MEYVKVVLDYLVPAFKFLGAACVSGFLGFLLAERFIPRSVEAPLKRMVATLGACGFAFGFNYLEIFNGFGSWSPKAWAAAVLAGVAGSTLAELIHDGDHAWLAWLKRKPVAE